MNVAQLLASGTEFGRYRIVRRIGAGGTGAVYEAEHIGLKKRVAIKILFPQLALNEDVRDRFLREGEASARVHHPHVVDVTDVGVHSDMPYLVMEYLEGMDLATLLAQRRKLPLEQLADLMVPACAALAEAHKQRVIHRDLKPANIFLVDDPLYGLQPKILDFGISKITRDGEMGLTTDGALVGTPSYMSPEQARGDPSIDSRTDQYSLGVIMFEAATGTRAFKGASVYELLNKIVSGSFEAPRTVTPELPEAFEALTLRAMSLAPEQRFSDMLELGVALLPFASERTRFVWEPVLRSGGRLSEAPSPTLVHWTGGGTASLPPKKANRARAFSVGIAVLVVVAGAGVLLMRSRDAVVQLDAIVTAPPEAIIAAPIEGAAQPTPLPVPAKTSSSTATTTEAYASAAETPSSTRAHSASEIATQVARLIAVPTDPPHPDVAPPASPSPRVERDARCKPVTVTAHDIQVAGAESIALPIQRRGQVFEPLDRALGRNCPAVTMLVSREVPYSVAFPAISTVLQHTTVGIDVRTKHADAPVRLPAGLGDASINVLAMELTDKEVRFRLLVGGELPKRGTPLAKLGTPLVRGDLAVLSARLDALVAALPKESILYLGATAAMPFGEIRDVLVVAQPRFRQLRLSWIE